MTQRKRKITPNFKIGSNLHILSKLRGLIFYPERKTITRATQERTGSGGESLGRARERGKGEYSICSHKNIFGCSFR